MDARPFSLNNLRRAAAERRKAAAALTEAARRTHIELAEIFEARAGLCAAAADGSNVIQLRPEKAREAREVSRTTNSPARRAGSRRRPARG